MNPLKLLFLPDRTHNKDPYKSSEVIWGERCKIAQAIFKKEFTAPKISHVVYPDGTIKQITK